MKHTVTVVVKQGPFELARVEGRSIDSDVLTAEDVSARVIETEQYLERITGLRWHLQLEAK